MVPLQGRSPPIIVQWSSRADTKGSVVLYCVDSGAAGNAASGAEDSGSFLLFALCKHFAKQNHRDSKSRVCRKESILPLIDTNCSIDPCRCCWGDDELIE